MSSAMLFSDVDTQHDFMDADGKLPVPGALSIVPNLRRLTQFAAERRIPIVATADAHPLGDPEFEEFGEHCVPGTLGQRRIDETSLPGREVADPETLDAQVARLASADIPQLIIEKQALDAFTVPFAEQVLERLHPDRVFVYGVATEYCVRAEVLGLARRGYKVTVISDAIMPISKEDGEKAVVEMREAGAEMADTDTALRLASEALEA